MLMLLFGQVGIINTDKGIETMPRTSFDRALDKVQNLKSEARTIFREARKWQQSHAVLLANVSARVWKKRDGLPRWAVAELDGYVRALFDDNEDMTRHCYVMAGDEIVELGDYSRFTPQQVANEHVASGTFWKGDYKPYFVQYRGTQEQWEPGKEHPHKRIPAWALQVAQEIDAQVKKDLAKVNG